jgi:hypothetical protein
VILLFDKWLDEHYRGLDPAVLARVREIIEQNLAFDAELGALLGMSELFMTGGRRSGKTFLMEGILCSYAGTAAVLTSQVGHEHDQAKPKSSDAR